MTSWRCVKEPVPEHDDLGKYLACIASPQESPPVIRLPSPDDLGRSMAEPAESLPAGTTRYEPQD
jgi:hypothetical protein